MDPIILLVDMESFYASVEIVRNPSLRGKPVAVCGDPQHRRGIVLAANKEAKAYGIKTGIPAWECQNLCSWAILIRPHMQAYLETSLKITSVLEQFTDRIAPYSIDEQFLDMTGCEGLFGTPEEMASRINRQILAKTGIRSRIGIGANPLQAKMACDRFAKKNEKGIFRLTPENYAQHTWPLPIRDLFGVGVRMEKKLHNMGVFKIGNLARLPKETLRKRWGINGEVLWLNSRGIDYSTVKVPTGDPQRGIGHSLTLPRDYTSKEEIKVVLLELAEEVCRRARAFNKVGSIVGLYCRGAGFNHPAVFYRQKTLAEPTADTKTVYTQILELFRVHWDRSPVRKLGVSLSRLVAGNAVQLTLFKNQEKILALGRSMDTARERFGTTALFWASSLTSGSQLLEQAGKIGGHWA